MPKKSQINLLPQEEFEASLVGRALKWAMSTFRIIVIITEMIVMGAFLSRFWLDAQNSDLSEAITIEVAQIEARKDLENQFRDVQKKLAIFKTVSGGVKSSSKMQLISTRLPSEVYLTSVTSQEESTVIKGVAGTDQAIAQLITNLKGSPDTFKKVDLTSINSSEDDPNLTIFTIRVTF